MDWDDWFTAEKAGMAGGQEVVGIEDLYQAFKKRLTEELERFECKTQRTGGLTMPGIWWVDIEKKDDVLEELEKAKRIVSGVLERCCFTRPIELELKTVRDTLGAVSVFIEA